ncbi:MAG: hypothetical protein IPP88_05500 [Betaproteobacteria bacterium]|nr:hypothetical protein [Betaproteobacteria bacterium]
MSPAIPVFWQRYGLTAMLGVAAVGCMSAIGYETDWGQALRSPLPTASDAARAPDIVATLPGFTMLALDSAFRETAERPLFTPTRRPAAANLAANVPVMKKGQFKLSGTSVSNDLTVAFLRETATGKTVRVTKGKEINGMVLEAVEANRVVLKQGEETEELTLRTAASPPPAPMAAAHAPPSVVTPTPGGAQPAVATVMAETAQPAPRPVPNPVVPASGSSQLPGFVLPNGTAQVATPSAAPAESAVAQRRRRFQTTPQQ